MSNYYLSTPPQNVFLRLVYMIPSLMLVNISSDSKIVIVFYGTYFIWVSLSHRKNSISSIYPKDDHQIGIYRCLAMESYAHDIHTRENTEWIRCDKIEIEKHLFSWITRYNFEPQLDQSPTKATTTTLTINNNLDQKRVVGWETIWSKTGELSTNKSRTPLPLTIWWNTSSFEV